MVPLVAQDAGLLRGPLSMQHEHALAAANKRMRKVHNAAKVAAFNGWTAAVFAVLCFPFAVFVVTAMVMGMALAIVAWNEFRGRTMLRQFDRRGPNLLGWNQIGFMGLLIAYCAWQIYANLTGVDPVEKHLAGYPELATMLGPIDQLHVILTLGVYGGVMIFSILYQGLNAWYYFSRAKYLVTYLDQTEPWIIDLQRLSAVT